MPQRNEDDGGVDRLPSFITGGQPQGQQGHQGQPQGQNGGYEGQGGGGDRFPLHRRRRRHRGPRGDMPSQSGGSEPAEDTVPQGPAVD